MGELETTLETLGLAQAGFFRAADTISATKWNTKPRLEEWCAAELVAHLITVERAVLGSADRISQKTPKHIPYLKRYHLPISLVRYRVIRRKSPIPLDHSMLGSKEKMLAELRAVRERTLSFLDETKDRDLSVYRWQHAFLGMLTVYEWFEMVAAHQERHTKQIREIAKHIPKAVGNS